MVSLPLGTVVAKVVPGLRAAGRSAGVVVVVVVVGECDSVLEAGFLPLISFTKLMRGRI